MFASCLLFGLSLSVLSHVFSGKFRVVLPVTELRAYSRRYHELTALTTDDGGGSTNIETNRSMLLDLEEGGIALALLYVAYECLFLSEERSVFFCPDRQSTA